MGTNKDHFETGVDMLVSLINQEGRISFSDAANKLAVPLTSIEEWSHMLEEENVLDIEYKFTKPYLVKKQLTDEQKQQKLEAFKSSKDIFENKVEAASSYFEELDKKIVAVTKIFSAVEGNMSEHLSSVEDEIISLQKAERQKQQLDEQIIETKQRSLDKIKEIEDHLRTEKISYEKEFASARNELDSDQEMLSQSQTFLQKVKDEENYLERRLKEVNDMSMKIHEEVAARAQLLTQTEKHIEQVKTKHEFLKKELDVEKVQLQNVIKENEEQEELISKLQKKILEKMTAEEESLTTKENEIKDIPRRFKQLLEHKTEIRDLINIINHEEVELKAEVGELRKQAKLLEFAIGTKEFDGEMTRLNEKLDAITSKREFFKDKVTKLIQLLDWK